MRLPFIHEAKFFSGPNSLSGYSPIGTFDCRVVAQNHILEQSGQPDRTHWITIEDHIPAHGWTAGVWDPLAADAVAWPDLDADPTFQCWYVDRVQYQGQDYYRAALVPIYPDFVQPLDPDPPSTTCGDAPTIELDFDYTFDISTTGGLWLRFDMSAVSGDYEILLTVNSGMFSTPFDCLYGDDCSSLTGFYGLDEMSTPATRTIGTENFWYVNCPMGLFACNVTLRCQAA